MLRIGYSFWGFLGDYKYENGEEVSTPDGNASYSWAIVHEAVKRGHQVIPLQKDRDKEGYAKHGSNLFGSFSAQKREDAYKHLASNGRAFESDRRHPELDVLLVEWRFPIHGRNCVGLWEGAPAFPTGVLDKPWEAEKHELQSDLARQYHILKHYSDLGVPIILWDLDHKLTYDDERSWSPAAIFETSQNPRAQHIVRTQVEFPLVQEDLLQHPTLEADPNRKLVYVGNRYERDEMISLLVDPVAKKFPGQVEFWGKWLEADQLWPDIKYHGRIAMRDFREAYGTAVACPILAKKSYLETGFSTPRPWEALMFGTLPIGFEKHLGIKKYVHEEQYLWGGENLAETVEHMADVPLEERDLWRVELAHQLGFCDVKYFLDAVERVVL